MSLQFQSPVCIANSLWEKKLGKMEWASVSAFSFLASIKKPGGCLLSAEPLLHYDQNSHPVRKTEAVRPPTLGLCQSSEELPCLGMIPF